MELKTTPLINQYKIVHDKPTRWSVSVLTDNGWCLVKGDCWSHDEAEFEMLWHNRKCINERNRLEAEQAHEVKETHYGPGVDKTD
jgi:hypothetical protein